MAEERDEATLRYIRELIGYLERYLSSKGLFADLEKIPVILENLSRSDEVSEKIVDNSLLGTKLFQKLRKYLSSHLSRIDRKLDEIMLQFALPLVLSKMAFDIFSLGKMKVIPPIKVPILTRQYLRSSIRSLKKIVERDKARRILEKKRYSELASLMRFKELIEIKKEELKAGLGRKFQRLIAGGLTSLEALELIKIMSRRELILGVLAFLEM